MQHNLQLQQHLERLLHTLQLSGDRKAALHEQILELQRPVDRCPSTTPPQPNDLVNEEEQQPTAEQQAAEQGPQETALGDDAGEGEGGQGIATPSTVDSGRKVRSEKHFPRSINTSTAPGRVICFFGGKVFRIQGCTVLCSVGGCWHADFVQQLHALVIPHLHSTMYTIIHLHPLLDTSHCTLSNPLHFSPLIFPLSFLPSHDVSLSFLPSHSVSHDRVVSVTTPMV